MVNAKRVILICTFSSLLIPVTRVAGIFLPNVGENT